jgi:hypothetical protein
VLRKIIFTGIIALVAVGAVQANEGKELRISGPVVRSSAHALSVENLVGDAVLTCAVPPRFAEVAAALKPGDRIRMACIRYRGRKAQLVKIQRLGDKAGEKRADDKNADEKKADEKKADEKRADEKRADEKRAEKQEAAGEIAELGRAAIVVQASDRRLACRVPAEKLGTLEGLKVGDKVKISCVDGQLAGIERAAATGGGEEVRLNGRIVALSRAAVTVQGEAGSLTCVPPASLFEKIAARFAVGDSVKMMCRGSELTYLEKI